MRHLTTSLLTIVVKSVYSNPALRDSKPSKSLVSSLKDSFQDQRDSSRLIVFLVLYGFFMILSAVVFFLYRRYKSKRQEVNNRATSQVHTDDPEERHSLSGISHESIEDIPERRSIRNNEEPVVVQVQEECPKEALLLPMHERIEYISYDKMFEIDKINLKRSRRLGSGNYGVVHEGLLKKPNDSWDDNKSEPLTIAMKTSLHHYDPFQEKLIYDELKLMCQIEKHPNVLALIGAVTPSLGRVKQTLIITEYIDCGDLLKFLRDRKSIFEDKLLNTEEGYLKPRSARRKMFGKQDSGPRIIEDSLDSLCTFDLLSFAYQIANGMEYLAMIKLVHRDLALRNILINKNKIIRIADFGLARQHKEKAYYRIQTETTRLPIYYVSPESFETSKFTEKSDVWSFGVCLFEIFSLGDEPYQNVSGDVIAYLKNGNRMEKPEFCHKDVYNFMTLCWSFDPIARPKFSKCMHFFEEHLKESAYELLETIDEKLHQEAEKQRQLNEWVRPND